MGTLLLATTEQGMVRVAFDREGIDEVIEELAREVSPRILRSPARLDVAAHELDEYFDGRRRSRSTCPWTCACRTASGARS